VNLSLVASALRSKDRMRILQLIGSEQLSSIEVYRRYSNKYSKEKHRESIYRDLEMLVAAGILEKKYSVEKKQITYSLKAKEISIELPSGKTIAK